MVDAGTRKASGDGFSWRCGKGDLDEQTRGRIDVDAVVGLGNQSGGIITGWYCGLTIRSCNGTPGVDRRRGDHPQIRCLRSVVTLEDKIFIATYTYRMRDLPNARDIKRYASMIAKVIKKTRLNITALPVSLTFKRQFARIFHLDDLYCVDSGSQNYSWSMQRLDSVLTIVVDLAVRLLTPTTHSSASLIETPVSVQEHCYKLSGK